MKTFRVTLCREIVVEMDAELAGDACRAALVANSNGEYNELWDATRTDWRGAREVTDPRNT